MGLGRLRPGRDDLNLPLVASLFVSVRVLGSYFERPRRSCLEEHLDPSVQVTGSYAECHVGSSPAGTPRWLSHP